MFTISSLSEFESYFDTEEKCSDFLKSVKWKDKITCPKCGGERVYETNSKTQPYKCGTRPCYSKFSITSDSLMANTKLSHKDWLLFIFLFVKTRGRMGSMHSGVKLNFATAYRVDEIMKTIFTPIIKEGKPLMTIFIEAVRNLFTLKELYHFHQRKNLDKRLSIDPEEIIDFNSPECYSRIIVFIKKQLNYAIFMRWIFYKFCEPEDILANMFIELAESSLEPPFKGEIVITLCRKIQTKMWGEYIYTQPKLQIWYKSTNKEAKRKIREQLSTCYVVELICNEEKRKGNWYDLKEIKADRSRIKNKINTVLSKRKRLRGQP